MNGITPVYTVSELNAAIKALLESNPHFMNLSVRGELSNYKVYPSGHHYFTLKDQDSSLRCVMFRSSAQKLRFRPENGLKVVISGSLKVYPRDGNYQIYCSAILPEGGLSLWRRQPFGRRCHGPAPHMRQGVQRRKIWMWTLSSRSRPSGFSWPC